MRAGAAEPGRLARLRVGVETSVGLFDAAGSGRYSREIVRALRDQAPADVEIVEIRAGASAGLAGSPWRRAAFVLWWELVYCRFLLPRRVQAEGLDLLHCTAPVPFPGRLGVPVITTIHDTFLFSHPEWFTPVRRRRTRRWWRVAARSEHVLASSRATQEALARDLGVPHARSSVVFLGTHVAPPAAARVAQTPFLLSVGTIEPRKNLFAVLEALALVKARRGDVPRLDLAGARGWGSVGLPEAVQRLGLTGHVRLLGFVPETRLAELYTTALGLVYASLDEGFGLPPLEAMACGCPVIASDVGSIPEVVGDAALLVDPRDVSQIAAAIETLIVDPDRRRDLRERGRQRALALTWAACAQATLEVYRRVAGESAGVRGGR